jgi:hypothetical protein
MLLCSQKYKNSVIEPASPHCIEGGGGDLCTNVFENIFVQLKEEKEIRIIVARLTIRSTLHVLYCVLHFIGCRDVLPGGCK